MTSPNEQPPVSSRLRVFVIALLGVAIGVGLSKVTDGNYAMLGAIVLGLLAFVFFRLRSGR